MVVKTKEATVAPETVRVFPNPAGAEVQVVAEQLLGVALFDISGRLLPADTVLGFGWASLNTAALARGIYLLKIRTARGMITKR